jgi:hypothetical protein
MSSAAIPEELRPWAHQRAPALAIVARGDQIAELSPVEFEVRSQSRPQTMHWVRVIREQWRCSSPFFHAWRTPCIHILAIRYRRGRPREVPR